MFNLGDPRFALRSLSSQTGRVLVNEMTDLVAREADNATSGSVTTD